MCYSFPPPSYKQRRFNLFREESEGYAKLITELNQDFSSEKVTLQKTLEIIKSLIGCFNLDPNRVLDIILESFETRPEQSKLFIPLLEAYTADGNIICEVLGYKYRHFADAPATPASLYKVTALLLQHQVIHLDDIYNWLSPSDKEMVADWEQELGDAKEFVRKLNVISTKGPEQEGENQGAENGGKEGAAGAAAASSSSSSSHSDSKYASNQKLGLCEALLLVGDWKSAQVLMRKLPDQSVIVHEPIARALCQLLHTVIEPVYREQCSLSMHIRGRPVKCHKSRLAPPQAKTLDELRDFAFPMFVSLGASLHYDPILMYKLIRLCRVVLQQLNVDASMAGPGEEEGLYYEMVTLLDACVLSSLSYLDCNCCLAEEIWSVVRLFPYQYRFCLYGRWKNDTYLQQPKLIRRRGEAQKQIKALMKRVSKENIKPVGRLIGKLSHCSPGFLFDYVSVDKVALNEMNRCKINISPFPDPAANPNLRQSDWPRRGLAQVPDQSLVRRAGLLPRRGPLQGGPQARRHFPVRVAAESGQLLRRHLQEVQHRAERAAAVRGEPVEGAKVPGPAHPEGGRAENGGHRGGRGNDDRSAEGAVRGRAVAQRGRLLCPGAQHEKVVAAAEGCAGQQRSVGGAVPVDCAAKVLRDLQGDGAQPLEAGGQVV